MEFNLIARPQEGDKTRLWVEAFDLWQASLHCAATRRAYREAWQYFLAFTQKAPWDIGRSDVARWAESIRQVGLSDCTRNLRLSAISAFYRYCCTEYTVVDAAGHEVPLHTFNPAGGRSLRAKVNPYGKAQPLTADGARQLLAAIPTSSVQGLRDYALFLAYLLTARRNSEVRQLRWGDLVESGGTVWYVWSGKGRKDQRYEMPRPVWDAIRAYLTAAGRLAAIQPGEYIFTALDGDGSHPLCMREVGRILKKYAKAAGLGDIHVHSLRHTAAVLRRQAGDDAENICKLLGHSSLAITWIYLSSVAGVQDKSWQGVGNLLGLEETHKG